MFKVQVCSASDGASVKDIKCRSLREAERVERGLLINMSDAFYTRIVDESGEEINGTTEQR